MAAEDCDCQFEERLDGGRIDCRARGAVQRGVLGLDVGALLRGSLGLHELTAEGRHHERLVSVRILVVFNRARAADRALRWDVPLRGAAIVRTSPLACRTCEHRRRALGGALLSFGTSAKRRVVGVRREKVKGARDGFAFPFAGARRD